MHAYAQWGTDCFRRFNGMWGLAILDERTATPRLVLARDHFGIKPLFYARHRGRVVFASEIKAILQDDTFPREVDEQQMYEYLRFGLFDHNDGTFFRGIRQVPAAAFAVIEGSTISESVYWTPRLSEDGDASPEAFRAVFERAVQRRLVADVPVGICLSGGLDSSSICTVMAQQLRDHVPDTESLGDRLKTFSAVFPGDRIDESTYIDSVLKVTGADNSQVQPTDQDFIRELEAWVWHMEEPMVSSAPFAMWMVMRLARRQVTVTLDGQAGDELLAGYDHYPYVLLRQLLRERRYAEFAREAWLLRDIVTPLVRRRLRERGQRVDVAGMLSPSFTPWTQAAGGRPRRRRPQAPPAPGLPHLQPAAAAALRGSRLDGALARGAVALPGPGAGRLHPHAAALRRSSTTDGRGRSSVRRCTASCPARSRRAARRSASRRPSSAGTGVSARCCRA